MAHQRGSKTEGAEFERPSRVHGETGRASVPPRDRDEAVTSKVVPRDRVARSGAGRDDSRSRESDVPKEHERVEREPMARVVDAAAWREERPRLQGERDSIPPRPTRGE